MYDRTRRRRRGVPVGITIRRLSSTRSPLRSMRAALSDSGSWLLPWLNSSNLSNAWRSASGSEAFVTEMNVASAACFGQGCSANAVACTQSATRSVGLMRDRR
jgi:hypothetical protein